MVEALQEHRKKLTRMHEEEDHMPCSAKVAGEDIEMAECPVETAGDNHDNEERGTSNSMVGCH